MLSQRNLLLELLQIDYLQHSEDYCRNGICEIRGRRGSQEDDVADAYLPQFNALPASEQEQVLRNTIQEMQARFGNHSKCGSTACLTMSWMKQQNNQRSVKFCNANVGDSAAFLVIVDEEGNFVQAQKINPIHDGELSMTINQFRCLLRMTHSIGDTMFELAGLSHQPHITSGEVILKEGHRAFLITGCDGLTEGIHRKGHQSKAEREILEISACIISILKEARENGTRGYDIKDLIAVGLVKMAYGGSSYRKNFFGKKKSLLPSHDNVSVMAKEILLGEEPQLSAMFDGHNGKIVANDLALHVVSILENNLSAMLKKHHRRNPCSLSYLAQSMESWLSSAWSLVSNQPSQTHEEKPTLRIR